VDRQTVAADATTMSRFFRVLSDRTRIRLIQVLAQDERSVTELVDALGQAQPRVSTHLACLRHCGFVESRRQGKEMIYRLCLANLPELLDRAAAITGPLASRLATCDRVGPAWI